MNSELLIQAIGWALSDDPEQREKAEAIKVQAELEQAREDAERDQWAEATYWQRRVEHDKRTDPITPHPDKVSQHAIH